jgi:predicted PurR-regulated permease PerM
MNWGLRSQQAVVVIAIVTVIGALHVAKAAVVPVLFAVFLAMLLAPAVQALRRLRMPRPIAAALVVTLLIAVVAIGLNATWKPARDWLDTAPATMRTLERKLRPVTRFIAQVESVSDQAGRVTDPTSANGPDAPPPVVAADAKSTVANTQDWLIAFATMLMVAYFLLAGGPSLLMRLEAARGGHAETARLLQLATTISAGLGRYFATVTLCNLLLGIGTTVTMHWLGMPNALLWGMVAFLLNYVPYAGSATTFVLLTVVAVVSFEGLGKAFAVAACYLTLTTIEGQILNPVLVGRRMDVSPLVVVLSLWFGGWLWGIAGVVLAVPLLVAAKALANELEGPMLSDVGGPPRPDSTMRSRAAELLAARAARHRRPEPKQR